jgi:hypothetical protein
MGTGIDLASLIANHGMSPGQVADALSDACAAAYLGRFPDADLTTFTYLDAEFLFDANPKYDRTVLVVGQPAPPTAPRDETPQRGYPLRRELGEHETLLGIDHAREVLGYAPQYSWRAQH